MLTENGKNALPEPIVKRLDEINTLCLETMGKRIKEIGELSPSDAHKLARQLKLGADVRKIERELSKATALSVADIEKIFEIVANDNVETAKAMLEAGGAVIPYAENKELQRWVSALAKQTEQELINLAKTTAFMRFDENGNKILTSLSKTYNDVIDKAVASASSGVVDYKTAMRKTLKDLADSGLRTKYKKLEGSAGPTVDYASGYSRRLDTAVRQNILWGIKECNLGVQEQIGEEFNADGYEIDYHRNPRPSHAEMGGRQYVKGKARYIKGKYYESFEVKAEPLLAEYGCLHFKFPIICGISRPIYSDEELAKLKAEDNKTFEYEGKTYTGYEAKQMQRKLETAIRHAKDRQKIAKAAGDDTLRRQEQKRLNDLTRKYKDFSEKAGLSVKKDRMSVSGYHRVKLLDNGGGSGIIKLQVNLFDKTDPLYLDSFSIEEEYGFEDICIHGSAFYVQKTINGKITNMNAKEFAEYLKTTSYNGGDIRLASCCTGKGENSFAQQLSKELGVKVKAPDDDVYYAPNEGTLFIGSPYHNIGKWRTFFKGDEIQ